MDETDKNLRKATLDTLSFLASPEQQREFAAKVHYDNYPGEFACWWFDSFIPESPYTEKRYTNNELTVLHQFSQRLDELLKRLDDKPRTIDSLIGNPDWAEVIVSAKRACIALALHA